MNALCKYGKPPLENKNFWIQSFVDKSLRVTKCVMFKQAHSNGEAWRGRGDAVSCVRAR